LRTWQKNHTVTEPFPEIPPFKTIATLIARRAGEFPPQSSWAGQVQSLWNLLELGDCQPLPDLSKFHAAASEHRVQMAGQISKLAADTFEALGMTQATGGSAFLSEEQSWHNLKAANEQRLAICTMSEKEAYCSYAWALLMMGIRQARDLGDNPTKGPTDKKTRTIAGQRSRPTSRNVVSKL